MKSVVSITIIILIILYAAIFIVKEGECGVILRFGKILCENENKPLIYNPGLHFKVPFIESVKILDSRIQTIEDNSRPFITKEKKNLIVNSYIKWRISNFRRYYLATNGGDLSQAEILLKRKYVDSMRSKISYLSLKDIITDSQDRLTIEIRNSLNFGSIGFSLLENNNQKKESSKLENSVVKSSKLVQVKIYNRTSSFNMNSMTAMGIEIIDVRIKEVKFPKEVSEAVYNRMRAERQVIARYLRSQGQEEAKKLRFAADYEAKKTLAKAEKQGCILRGEGDAEAMKLFADAFSENTNFYVFIRSLLAYENSFKSNQDFMVLSPDNDFFRYMKNMK